MKMLVAAALSASAMSASAQESQYGWEIRFAQDTFDKSIYPIALASDEAAAVGIVCDDEGMAPFIQTRLAGGEEVEFRADSQREAFAFDYVDAAPASSSLRLQSGDAGSFLTMFANAEGQPVAYRTPSGRQGLLPSIGAAEAIAIMRDHCSTE